MPLPKPTKSDLNAGLSTALFSIPEGLAFAQLAGVNPIFGLYSGIIATIISAITTDSPLMVSTLTSAVAISTASVLQSSQLDPYLTFPTLTFLVGIIMIVLGIFRCGSIINYVSNAVMTGFIVGAALLIVIGTLPHLTQIQTYAHTPLIQLLNTIEQFNSWSTTTITVSIFSVALLLLFKNIHHTHRYASILTIASASLLIKLLPLSGIHTIADITSLQHITPIYSPPQLQYIPTLTLGAVSIAIIAIIQGAGISSTIGQKTNNSVPSHSRDFLGQGLGNLVGALFHSLPTGGSLSRTAISIDAGAQSRWAAVFTGLFIGVIVLFCTPLIQHIPLATIAAILAVIGIELIISRLPDIKLIFVSSPLQLGAGLITVISTLFIPLQYTIFIGAILSLIIFLYQSGTDITIDYITRDRKGKFIQLPLPENFHAHTAAIIEIESNHLFAEVPFIQSHLPGLDQTTGAVIILRLRNIHSMPSNKIKWIKQYAHQLQETGNILMLSGVNTRLYSTLLTTGIVQTLGASNIFIATAQHEQSSNAALDAAQQWIDKQFRNTT